MDDLNEVKKRLAAIESLLQRLPEIQAAVFIQMWDEYQGNRLRGVRPDQLWTIASPDQR